MCVLAECGRFLLYNILVDGEDCDTDDQEPDDSSDIGYKQMLLVLQSTEVETGKSFLADLILRIFHGVKTSKHATLSFESAKTLLGRGEPVVIGLSTFYNNRLNLKLLKHRIGDN